ncbi:PH domain-containing protein [Amycolatopsis sp. H20-H5]|uniref:PH domain-containing protein n=1 Tax=Amycolatopsis sp. H20-H5 TaxID=3046309 RepID=UPI002DBABD93|nr:PH domain-containing protein [Amycolatopsis sp. H20-H5]MEC3974554.1 PH domain-containing protein [Amycolatopsis sp. H20-H5]
MDNYPATWSPRPALVVLAGVIAVVLLAGTVLDAVSGDRAGAVLFGLATVAVGAYAAHSALVRPRLAADVEGLRARTVGGTLQLAWAGTRIRLRTTRRLGRDTETLEVESGDHLLVFGRLDLGEDPRDVLDVLSALRAQG